jgi:hypothetical protein
MEIEYIDNKIVLEKELNDLDLFTLDFTNILNKLNIKYVIVSGYVAILFGRSRGSEDVDLIIENMDYSKFNELWTELYTKFECILVDTPKIAYDDYLKLKDRLRFAKADTFIPNMEVKIPSTDIENWVLANSIEVNLNQNKLFISSFELQIAYKLYLGSEKDIEDARYLYKLFSDRLDQNKLSEFINLLEVKNKLERYLL